MVLFFRFTFPSRQFRNQILKLAFSIRLLFMCIFYGSIHIRLYTCIIDLSGDIEKNPGPRPSSSQHFSICHWNLNSIITHSYINISLLKAYLSILRFNIVCFSETNLDTSVRLYDVNLDITGL